MTPETVTLPAPPKVRELEPLFKAPESVSVSASELIRVAPVLVIAPAKLLFPLMLRNAPVLEIPSPISEVMALAPTLMPPLKRKAAPVPTEIEPAVVPSAAAFCIST